MEDFRQEHDLEEGRSRRSEHYLQKGGKSRDAVIQVTDDGGLMLEKELQGSRKVRDSERSLGASSQWEWGMDKPQRVRQMEARMLRFGVQATRKKAEPLTETANMDGGGGWEEDFKATLTSLNSHSHAPCPGLLRSCPSLIGSPTWMNLIVGCSIPTGLQHPETFLYLPTLILAVSLWLLF